MNAGLLPIETAPEVAFGALGPAVRLALLGEHAPGLALLLAARLAGDGREVHYVCGDNRFDPYQVARLARQRGVSAESALRRILIARPFTSSQMAEMIARLAGGPAPELLIVSGATERFLDEDLSDEDAARLFYRMLWHLAEITGRGAALVFAQGACEAPRRRAHFLRDLCLASSVVLRVEGGADFSLERRRAAFVSRPPARRKVR